MKALSRGVLWGVGALAALVALLLAVPFLVPIESFIPQLAATASAKLGQPVSIAGLELHLVPTPRAIATGITVGKKEDVRIEELEIVPELFSFVSGPRTLRLIRAEKVRLKDSAFAIAGSMPKGDPGEPVNVRRIALRNVLFTQKGLQLPEFDADAWLAEGYRVERVRLEAGESELVLRLEPESDTAAKFDVSGKLYGGTLAAAGRADWAKQWQVAGKAKLERVNIAPLQVALGKPPKLTGRLHADASFSARARTPALLADALVLDGPFEVVGGAYQGYDLSRISTGRLPSGGSTKFEEMKGKLQVRGKRSRIEDLCVRSPQLVAGGRMEVAPDQKLSGKLDVSVAKTGGFVGIPVQLSGTTSDPSIMPSKGYLIGAAVGTVLLPGIGTSIGASAGSRIEGTSGCK
jgi:hypothetical protein